MKVKNSTELSEEKLDSASGGFTQWDPGHVYQMRTKFKNQEEADILNNALGLKGTKRFSAKGGYYDRDAFAERGLSSSSGNDLREKLERYGLTYGGRQGV